MTDIIGFETHDREAEEVVQEMNPLVETGDELDELLVAYSEDPDFVEALRSAEDLHRLKVELQKRRRALGLSQTQVAQSMNTTQSHVSEFENGASDPHLSTYQRYARAVGMRLRVSLDPVYRRSGAKGN